MPNRKGGRTVLSVISELQDGVPVMSPQLNLSDVDIDEAFDYLYKSDRELIADIVKNALGTAFKRARKHDSLTYVQVLTGFAGVAETYWLGPLELELILAKSGITPEYAQEDLPGILEVQISDALRYYGMEEWLEEQGLYFEVHHGLREGFDGIVLSVRFKAGRV
jgi:hypothetical protein